MSISIQNPCSTKVDHNGRVQKCKLDKIYQVKQGLMSINIQNPCFTNVHWENNGRFYARNQ